MKSRILILVSSLVGLTTQLVPQESGLVPLFRLYNDDRGDNFTTTDTRWQAARVNDVIGTPPYRYHGIEGRVFSRAQPGTVPLMLWYSARRGDNLTTADPAWRSTPQEPSYGLAERGIEGYVFAPDAPQPPGTIPLFSVWSPRREDNFLTTDRYWKGTRFGERVGDPSLDYVFVRTEGYIYPAEGSGGLPIQYVTYNVLQVEIARRPVWAGVLTYYGASPEQVAKYGLLLERLAEHAFRNDRRAGAQTLHELAGVVSGLDFQLARRLGIDLAEASQLRVASLEGERQNFRRQCGVSQAAEGAFYHTNLPVGPSVGFESRTSMTAALGRCQGSGAYGGINTRTGQGSGGPPDFIACLQSSRFANFKRDCGDPAAEGKDPASGGEGPGPATRDPDTGRPDPAEVKDPNPGTQDPQGPFSPPAGTPPVAPPELPPLEMATIHVDTEVLGIKLDFDAGGWVHVEGLGGAGVPSFGPNEVGVGGIPGSRLPGFPDPGTPGNTFGIVFGGRFSCAVSNPAAELPMGYRRSVTVASAGYMTNADVALSCMCKGRNTVTASFASNALEVMGVSGGCNSSTWQARTDCVRPGSNQTTCAEFLRMDHPQVRPDLFCQSVISCPNARSVASPLPNGTFGCGCNGAPTVMPGGRGSNRPPGCELVQCPVGDNTSRCCTQQPGPTIGPFRIGTPAGATLPLPPVRPNVPKPQK